MTKIFGITFLRSSTQAVAVSAPVAAPSVLDAKQLSAVGGGLGARIGGVSTLAPKGTW